MLDLDGSGRSGGSAETDVDLRRVVAGDDRRVLGYELPLPDDPCSASTTSGAARGRGLQPELEPVDEPDVRGRVRPGPGAGRGGGGGRHPGRAGRGRGGAWTCTPRAGGRGGGWKRGAWRREGLAGRAARLGDPLRPPAPALDDEGSAVTE
jgi:hypothetical protein